MLLALLLGARAASGFSTDLRTLLSLGGTEAVATCAILARHSDEPALLAAVAALRGTGERVVSVLPDTPLVKAELGCDRQLVKQPDGSYVVVAFDE